MQPSTGFIRGLTASEASRIQHRLLEQIRSGQPKSDDPGTILARVKRKLEARVNDDTARELLGRLSALADDARELELHDVEHEGLSPEEKRRRTAQKATYYSHLTGLSSPENEEDRPPLRGQLSWTSKPQMAGRREETARDSRGREGQSCRQKRLGSELNKIRGTRKGTERDANTTVL